MSRFFILNIFIFSWIPVFAQPAPSAHTDTMPGTKVLQSVTVEAFYSRMMWKETPAAVAPLNREEFGRYTGVSLAPALNTVPGVRMEERSPSSFRLSMRGSLLRSPFGVRNVKVYWNDIPLTDGGGNTYLNLLDINQVTSAELIKGPVASSYGAGTGGALLLRSETGFAAKDTDMVGAGVTGGSYGLFTEQAAWERRSRHFSSSLQQEHSGADGYRQQSRSRKDAILWLGNWKSEATELKFLVFYTDLFYQTPGGLTLAQYLADPKLARPSANGIPGSVVQQAAIYNKTLFAAVHQETGLGNGWTLNDFLMGNHTAFTNPFITNYEKRGEANWAAGASFSYRTKALQWVTGGEWLHNHSLINDYGNRGGMADTVQFKDDIYAVQWFAFSQVEITAGHWVVTAGASVNNQSYRYKRVSDPNPIFTEKRIASVLTPRVALLYRLSHDVSAYAVAAKGFSPPAVAEVRPSDGNYYGNLNAEYGWNYEGGIKGEVLNHRVRFDLAAYFFGLRNAIVRRVNASGAEYFVNAGNTRQNGMEALVSWKAITSGLHRLRSLQFWTSYSYQPYRFVDYEQAGTSYSGNAVTGVPRNIFACGIDLETHGGFYGHISLNATSRLPLTDANDAYADAYQLLQCKTGYRFSVRRQQWNVFAGADNLLNQVYSLGNDINAAGKRYYNAAPGRNFSAGISIAFGPARH